jgi:hypothetical protein
MISAALVLAAQAASFAPAPVVVVNTPPQSTAAGAMSWSCEVVRRHNAVALVSGEFPAVSVDAQKNGNALHLHAGVKSANDQLLNGNFPAALTKNVLGISTYSIMVPGSEPGRPKFILTFMFFADSHGGVLSVLQFALSSGRPNAYAAGLCETQASQ